MTRQRIALSIFCLLLLLSGTSLIYALWTQDGSPVCTATGTQQNPKISPDGAGGVFVVWQDGRGGDDDIYIQRVDALGDTAWARDGVAVCTQAGDQISPEVISDGAGGAIVAWADGRDGDWDVYAQRLSGNGMPQWQADGVPVCSLAYNQYSPSLTTDGAGGAIVAWTDMRQNDVNDRDIYVQRVDASGVPQWTPDGVAICNLWNWEQTPRIVSDGGGGAIMTWQDIRTGGWWRIYAQRVNSSGIPQWPTNGALISDAAGNQVEPHLAPDGVGGAIITWFAVTGSANDIFAQRIDSTGVTRWTEDGITVCGAAGDERNPWIVDDGMGGGIIAWIDPRDGDYDIYAARVDTTGTVHWTTNGVALCTATGDQLRPRLASDGAGGAIVAWYDERAGPTAVYAQRVDSAGAVRWSSDGVSVATATGAQLNPEVAAAAGGGVFVTWQDDRSIDTDIYVQRLDSTGAVYEPPVDPRPAITSIADVPGDQGGVLRLEWQRSIADTVPNTEITHYSVWRRLSGAAPSGGRANSPHVPVDFAGGATRVANGGTVWEWIVNRTANHSATYVQTVPSLYDSMGTDPGWQTFMVSAHTSDLAVYYDSPVDSGYSVDNIAPYPPAMLAGARLEGSDHLRLWWEASKDADLWRYAVYRGASAGFIPRPENRVAVTEETEFVDTEWAPGCGWFYKISAVDENGNEGSHALLRPRDIPGEGAQTPQAKYLAQNYPNPFNPATHIPFGLERPSPVRLAIYDARGALVRVLVSETRDAGIYVESWDGRDGNNQPVASGVYFYRLAAGAFAQTRKMVLLR